MSPKISSSELSQMSPEQRRTMLKVLNEEADNNPVVKFVLAEWRFNEKHEQGRVTQHAMNRYLKAAKNANFTPEKLDEVEQKIMGANIKNLPEHLKEGAQQVKDALEFERNKHVIAEQEAKEKFDILAVGNAVINDPKSLGIDKIFPALRLIGESAEKGEVTMEWAQEVKQSFAHAPKRIMEDASDDDTKNAKAQAGYYEQAFKHFGHAIPDPIENGMMLWEKQKEEVIADSREGTKQASPTKRARITVPRLVKN